MFMCVSALAHVYVSVTLHAHTYVENGKWERKSYIIFTRHTAVSMRGHAALYRTRH